MAARGKIVDHSEVDRWIEEGRTFRWMAEEYLHKYALEVVPTMFSNYRARRGFPRRLTWNDELIPWEIKVEHRWGKPVWALRTEAKLRGGVRVPEDSAERLRKYKDQMDEDGVVIHYDPDTEQGWWLLPRRPGVDLDMIRVPARSTRKRRAMS